jgi:hypothetical protein
MSEPQPPWVDPASIPELAEILRRRLLSKVRIFEGWCENGDRLFQVVKVHGRPLALAETMSVAATGSPNPDYRRGTHSAHRSHYEAAWLDLSWNAYFAPIMLPPEESPGARQWVLTPYLLSAQCQHESLPVPLDWLREQVNAGVSKRVITQTVRFEMGARRRSQ